MRSARRCGTTSAKLENLPDIAIFVRVVEAASFTQAADALGISQSVVSRSVTALEARLGVRLLNRTTRRLSLTEAGAELYRRASQALGELEEAQLEVTRFQAEPRGLLRVSAPTSFSLMHLAPLVQPFLAVNPGVRINLQLDDRQVDLVEEGFDLAIRVARLRDSTLVAQRLAPARQVVCASASYLEKHGEPERPEDLVRHDCIVYTYGQSPGKWRFKTAGNEEEIVVPVQGTLQTNNGMVERAAALDGLGLCLLPTFYIGDELRSGALRAVLTDFPPVELAIYAVYPERRNLSPKVRAYVDYLRQKFGDRPYWDRGLFTQR
jgi:DNA-binding transcriptional LysR family regulator